MISIRVELGAANVTLSVNTIVKGFASRSTKSKLGNSLVYVSTRQCREHPVGILRAFRDDIDYSINGVRSPDCSARPANHFDAIDILEHCVLYLPVNAGKERRIHAATVNQDEQ